MTPQEILASALRVWDTKGWCTGSVDDNKGNHCAMGAVNLAHHQVPTYGSASRPYGGSRNDPAWVQAVALLDRHIRTDDPAYQAVVGKWRSHSGLPLHRVVAYNNTRQSFDEIREWFEKAAADERVEP